MSAVVGVSVLVASLLAERRVVVGVGVDLVGLGVVRVALATRVLGLRRGLLGRRLLAPGAGGGLVGLGLGPVGLVPVHLGLLAYLARLVPVLFALLLALLLADGQREHDCGDHHQRRSR